MKLKKFFAGVLAAAMMLTVGATAAFAETGADEAATTANAPLLGNTGLNVNDNIPIYKTYEVKKGVSPEETFYFQIDYVKAIKQDSNGYAPYTGAHENVATKDVKFESMIGAKTDSKAFNVTPAELNLNNPTGTGKYLYKITETVGTNAAVTYQQSEVYMVVTVAHELEADNKTIKENSWKYYVTMYKTQSGAENATQTDKVNNTDAFKNTYGDNNISELTLKKVVKGSFGDLGEDFTFEVKFTKATDKTYSNILVDSKSADNVSIVKKGTTEQVTELSYDETYVVTLMHNQWIKFNNVASDVDYTIVENKKDNWQYTTSLQDGSNAAFTVATMTAAGTTKATASTDTFINEHEGTPDMGVVLDNAPYIAMLAIVAIGGVALMLNKRRRDEE
mgnify:FL=1